MTSDSSRRACKSCIFSDRTNNFASTVSTIYEERKWGAPSACPPERERKGKVTHSMHGRCTRLAPHASPLAQELFEHVMGCASKDTTEL